MKKLVQLIIVAIEIIIILSLLWLGLNGIPESTEATYVESSVATPVPTAEPAIIEAISTPTAEPVATATPTTVPTATPESTYTPTPTATPTPVPTSTPTPIPTPVVMEVHQIAVGCANAYLIKAGDMTIAIDGGLNDKTTRNRVLKYIEAAGVTRLTAYIATHYHGDHIGQMDNILSNFADNNTIVYGPSVNYAISSGKYQQMKNNDVIRFGDITLTCVGPDKVDANGKENKDSLNFVIEYGEHKFFFTGDYVRSKAVMAEHADLISDCDVFQFPHHGLESFCITKTAFKAVNPDIVLVPANSSGPSRRFAAELGIDADFYNNKNGNIAILTNGSTLEVYTEVQPGQFAN